MRSKILVVLVITIVARSNSSPDAVDDFNRITANLSNKSSSEVKITEEKQTTKVEIKSKGSDQTAFSSQFLHNGHNLFFQPQILIGPGIQAPFLSRVVEDTSERKSTNSTEVGIYINAKGKTEVTTTTTTTTPLPSSTSTTTELPSIPEAPVLPPLVLPDPPVFIQKPTVIEVPEPVKEVIIEHDSVVIPEPPAFIPLNPPKIEIIVPKAHIPTCLTNNILVGISVPCPPAVVVPPRVVVEETVIVPEPPVRTLRVPKIPLGVIYNRPVKTVMPIANGFVSTTRFLPSVKVSRIPLLPPKPRLIVEKIRGEKVRIIEEEAVSSFSAYCAHNIALERVLPNIIVGKEVRIAPLPPILEIPVRLVY